MGLFPDSMMKSNELTLETIASRLMYFQSQLHFLHWQTTSYAQHVALGSLYDYIHDFKDGLVEKLMGYSGRRVNIFKIDPITPIPAEGVVDELMSFASNLKSFANANGYQDIANLADSLSGEAAKVKYLLTLS